MIARQTNSDRASEGDGDDADSRTVGPRLTNLELRVGTLKLPPMWEIRDLAVKLRFPAASDPYATVFRLLVILLVIVSVVALVTYLPVP